MDIYIWSLNMKIRTTSHKRRVFPLNLKILTYINPWFHEPMFKIKKHKELCFLLSHHGIFFSLVFFWFNCLSVCLTFFEWLGGGIKSTCLFITFFYMVMGRSCLLFYKMVYKAHDIFFLFLQKKSHMRNVYGYNTDQGKRKRTQ